MKKILKWIFLFIISPGLLSAQSSTDTYEEKLYNIYKNSYSREVDDQLWEEYINSLKNLSYQVTEGDDLWTLSEVFFGSGHYWPKIWSYNERLTNPHLITVGQKILFFTGSVEEPPALKLEDQKQDQPPPSQQQADKGQDSKDNSGDGEEKDTNQDQIVAKKEGEKEDGNKDMEEPQKTKGMPGVSPVVIPPSREKIKPMAQIPPVFRKKDPYKYINSGKITLDLHVKEDFFRKTVQVTSFVYENGAENYPEKNGFLLESKDQKKLISLNDLVYIESEEDLKIGEQFAIMDEGYALKDLFSYFGSVINYLGTLRIIKKIDNNRYYAEILESYGKIKKGTWISRQQIPTLSMDYGEQYSELKVDILAGGSNKIKRIFSENDIVFLNGGSRQGLKNGDILGVYSRRDKRFRETNVRMSINPIAHIKIFNVGQSTASAYILDSSEAVLRGDQTGPPINIQTQAQAL